MTLNTTAGLSSYWKVRFFFADLKQKAGNTFQGISGDLAPPARIELTTNP